MTLPIGQKAPDFIAMTDENLLLSLKDLRGKKVVLYFYPKDNTPGCTKESCDFKDHIRDFTRLNTVILGVSRDSVKSHARFKSIFHLPFTLLADTDSALCSAYDVLVQKSLFGKKYEGIQRATYLIDEEGMIQAVWPKVSLLKHVSQVLAVLNGSAMVQAS